jgi:hypothetical protein
MDRRFMVWDEVTGITVDMIGQLSGMRSSGIATVSKITGGQTTARVRKLWLANIRTFKNKNVALTSVPYGIMIVPGIIGRAEDIARFDIMTVAGREEVDWKILINAKQRKKVKHVYTSEAAKALVYWVWTRKPDQIKWERGAEDKVLDLTNELCVKYTTEIPVVEPGEQRFRVARICVALAARFHSSDPTGQHIVVKKEHVELAGWLFQQCYDSDACGYHKYSLKQMGGGDLTPQQYKLIKSYFSNLSRPKAAVEAMAFAENLETIAVIDFAKRAGFLAEMVNMGLLKTTHGTLQKTEKFLQFYKRWTQEEDQ